MKLKLIDIKRHHALGEINDQEYYFAIQMLLTDKDLTDQQKILWKRLKQRLNK